VKTLLNNLTIRKKLLGAFLLIFVFAISIVFRGYFSLSKLQDTQNIVFQSYQLKSNMKDIKYWLINNQQKTTLIASSNSSEIVEEEWVAILENFDNIYLTSDKVSHYGANQEWRENVGSFYDILMNQGFEMNNVLETVLLPKIREIKNLRNGLNEINAQEIQHSIFDTAFTETADSTIDVLMIDNQTLAEKKIEIEILLTNYAKTNQNIINQIYDLEVEFDTIMEKELQLFDNVNKYTRYEIIILVIILFILFFYLIDSLSKNISKPIKKILENIKEISFGNLPEDLDENGKDEYGSLSQKINRIKQNLKRTKEFADSVGSGNFETNINVFENKGTIGQALAQMRDGLYKLAKDREKQTYEEEQRNWATRGLAKFADILRRNTDNISELALDIIKNLVYYLNANQGGLFVLNDNDMEDKHIELVSCFAFDRKKKMEKRIEMTEGLVGRCFGESETIYLTDVPENYVNITSGLGDASPRCLLLVPLKINEDVFGAIEIASFNKLEAYQIEFVEKVGENIAAALATAKMNAQTAILLEQARENAEEMAAQEEELRQNLEELQTTQEEAAHKEGIAVSFVNSVNHTIIRADFSLSGELQYANSRFLETLDYSSVEVNEQPYSMFLQEKDKPAFKAVWEKLSKGGRHYEGEVQYKTKKGFVWLLATYTAVRSINGELSKILFLAFNIDVSQKEKFYFRDLYLQTKDIYEKELIFMHKNWEQQIEKLMKQKQISTQ